MINSENEIREIETLADGSSVYEIGEPVKEISEDAGFYDNLAVNDLSDAGLKKLSTFLLEAIDEDIEARREWFQSIEKVKQYLGFTIEDLTDIPFKESTRTFDTTLSTALIRFYATTRAELLPQTGPAGFQIIGEETEEMEAAGEKVRDWLNYFLTIGDKAYYSDFERFLLHLGFNGSGFRKVYYDKIAGKPISRFINPKDFIIDGNCTSILDSNRLTHVLHLSKREIILNQQNGIYRDVDLPYLKANNSTNTEDDKDDTLVINKGDVDLNAYSNRSLFDVYEIHTYLNLSNFKTDPDDDELPLPYIVTIDQVSKEILAIRRNWEQDDSHKERINFFVQYNYLPGFGIYGLGLAHLIGANAITLTTLLRELVDAGKFKNLPAGLRTGGMGQQNNDLVVGPGQFVHVNTGGTPLKDAFLPLPYSEPSQTLRELRMEIMNQTKELGSTSEMGMMDSKEDIATGTAMAFLETNNRIQSSVLRSIHYSLTQELQLIDKLFRKSIDENFSQSFNGQNISYNDFRDEIEIIPISDPSCNSTIQRIMKAQATMQLAMQAPELHDMREVYKLNYEAQGLNIHDIDKILLPAQDEEEREIIPLDPVSENLNIIRGEPVKAAIWQEHAAHKLIHGMFAEQHPDLQAELMAHIREHEAYEYLIQMQNALGMELPSLEQLENPEIQNAIAMGVAQSLGYQANDEQETPAPIDPNALLLADIEAKQAEIAARERIANIKAETDVFKAQLDFEKEKAKIESSEDIAKLKSETELLKQENANAYL